jgi:hypothetical protein
VNAKANFGQVVVEVLDEKGKPTPGASVSGRGTFPQVILHPPPPAKAASVSHLYLQKSCHAAVSASPWKSRGEAAAKGCEGVSGVFDAAVLSGAGKKKLDRREREREEGTPETFRTSVSNSGEASIRAEMFSPRWCRLLTPVLKSLGCGFSAKDILASNPPPTPRQKWQALATCIFRKICHTAASASPRQWRGETAVNRFRAFSTLPCSHA